MLISKHKKAAINIRLLLTVQLRNFQMKEIVSNIFNCGSKHVILYFCFPIHLHSQHGAAWIWKPRHRSSSEYTHCRWKILPVIPMRQFCVFMCFNTTAQFITDDLCVTWRQAGHYSLKSIHPSSADWDKREWRSWQLALYWWKNVNVSRPRLNICWDVGTMAASYLKLNCATLRLHAETAVRQDDLSQCLRFTLGHIYVSHIVSLNYIMDLNAL